jgi:hypothetical protein
VEPDWRSRRTGNCQHDRVTIDEEWTFPSSADLAGLPADELPGKLLHDTAELRLRVAAQRK